MKITNKWLNDFRTPANGFLRKQLELLGVQWRPVNGWKQNVIGKEIPDSDAREFEMLSGKPVQLEKAPKDEILPVPDEMNVPQKFEEKKAMSNVNVQIWTDGSCFPNPGPGGWGWHRNDGAKCFNGVANTTNNRMEMTAILEAMRALPDGTNALIYSDSQYCIKGLTEWRQGWKRKNWMKKGEPMINRDLWLLLETELGRINASFQWVRGHNGDVNNEVADKLAGMGRASLTNAK